MRKITFIALIAIFSTSCTKKTYIEGSSNSQSSGTVLVDAVLSLHVIDNKPAGITDYFYYGDTVNVYTLYENVQDTSIQECYFWDPGNNTADSIFIRLYPGQNVSAIVRYMPQHIQGDWEVGIYLNGDFQRSLIFTLSQ